MNLTTDIMEAYRELYRATEAVLLAEGLDVPPVYELDALRIQARHDLDAAIEAEIRIAQAGFEPADLQEMRGD